MGLMDGLISSITSATSGGEGLILPTPVGQADKVPTSNGTDYVLQYPQDRSMETIRRQLLGSPIIAASYDSHIGGSSTTLNSQTAVYVSVYIPFPVLVTGALYSIANVPSFTGSNTNGLALYSHSAGTLTKLRETANDENNWKTNGVKQIPFASTITLNRGIYFVGFVYSASAATIAPSLRTAGINHLALGETNSARLFGSRNFQTSLPATESLSALVSATLFHMALY